MSIQEKYFEDSPIPVSIKGTEKILNQMKKCICKIHNKGIKGTGYFCKIPYPDPSNDFPVLITNNHILNIKDITHDSTITLSINDDDQFIDIKIDSRKVYSSEEFDTTIIQIDLEKDRINLDLEDFLEIDENMNKGFTSNLYSKHSIYCLHYPKGQNIEVSYGILSEIKDNYIFHNCSTENGSSGSPILSLNSFKVIGIHCGPSSDLSKNQGIFIQNPINEFCGIKTKKFRVKKLYNVDFKKKINSCKTLQNKYSTSNEMTIRYTVKEDTKIQLFSAEFVKNNKDKCKIVINDKEHDLYQYIDAKNLKHIKTIEIKLIEIKKITNMNKMFCNCLYLTSLPDIGNWDTSLVTDMSFMFCCCVSLTSFDGISKWNISNVSNISYMFWGCSTLTAIPDISNWNTSNVTDMSYLFNRCMSLVSLPDISKWDVSKLTKMNYMFNKCSNLTVLPDIDKWNIDKITDIKGLFNGCNKLTNIPGKFKIYA